MRDLHNVEILKGSYIRYVSGPRMGEFHFMRSNTKSGLLGWAGTAPLNLDNDNGVVPAYVVPEGTGTPTTIRHCIKLWRAAMGGDIRPSEFNGAVWVALDTLMSRGIPTTQQVIIFLTGTYTLSQLNGFGATYFRQITAGMFGLTVSNKMEAERFRRGL